MRAASRAFCNATPVKTILEAFMTQHIRAEWLQYEALCLNTALNINNVEKKNALQCLTQSLNK